MARLVRLALACAAAFSLAACESIEVDSPPVVVSDSAGVEIVVNREPLWSPDEGWEVSMVPSFVLGEIEGAELAKQFSQINAVLRLSDERLVVLDGDAGELRYFDEEGKHLATVGQKGEGPGEFGLPWKAFQWAGDTVIVEDYWRAKHVFFSPEPRFAREEMRQASPPIDVGPFVECLPFTLPDRSRLTCVSLPGESPAPADPGPGHLRKFNRMVRVPWDYSSIDTLGIYGGIEQWGISTPRGTDYFPHPFHSRTAVAASRFPLRIAIARNPEYSIEIWNADGRLERVIRREGARRAPTPEEMEWSEERLVSYARGDEALANRARAEVPVPDSLPAVFGLAYTSAGELLVGRSLFLDRPGERMEFDVFGSTGRWLGTVALPGRFVIQEVGEEEILGIWRDEFGVPYVHVYDLDRGSEP